MAETAGVSKSSVSREFVEESVAKLQELNERELSAEQIVSVYLDGMVYVTLIGETKAPPAMVILNWTAELKK